MHSIQFLLEYVHLFPKLYTILLVDVRCELSFFHSGEVCNPANIVKDDSFQIHFADMMRGAGVLTSFFIGVASEREQQSFGICRYKVQYL